VFNGNLYTLVRLCDLKLDLMRHDEIISLLELQDESFEPCVDLELSKGKQILDQLVGLTRDGEIISLLELQDESFELGEISDSLPCLVLLSEWGRKWIDRNNL